MVNVTTNKGRQKRYNNVTKKIIFCWINKYIYFVKKDNL